MSALNISFLLHSRPPEFYPKNSLETSVLPDPRKVFSLIFGYLFLLLTASLLLGGCSDKAANSAEKTSEKTPYYEKLSLNYQGTTGAVTLPELAEDLGYLAPLKLNYIGNTIGGPNDIQTMVTGDADFGTAFNGAIVKLKSSGVPIKAVIGSYGSDEKNNFGLYVLEGSSIKTARDLIGKKVAVNTLGAHYEAMLKEYLFRNHLSSAEITKVELVVIPPVNAEQVLRAKQVDAAVFGGILKEFALTHKGLRLVVTDVDLFGKFTAGAYVFREDFITQHPHSVARFVAGTAKAIEWARTQPRATVISRFKKIIAQRGRNENDLAVSYWQSTGIATSGGVILNSEFQAWIDMLVRDGQLQSGQVLAEAIYDNRFNPYRLDASQPLKTVQP